MCVCAIFCVFPVIFFLFACFFLWFFIGLSMVFLCFTKSFLWVGFSMGMLEVFDGFVCGSSAVMPLLVQSALISSFALWSFWGCLAL